MNIARLRLSAQHIARPLLDDPAAVVQRLGAVQAQDYLGALWAVGLRTRGATEASVEAAVSRGEIIRTWPMRRTLHFVAATDIRWMLELITPRLIAASASRYRFFELDGAVLARAGRVAEKALEGGKHMRRTGLYAVWNAAGIATGDSRGLHILSHLSQTGLLCFGARDGKQPTFTLLEEWAPAARPLERTAALAELARRYFTSHGPATVHDFAWWTGLTIGDARIAVELASPHLVEDEVDGQAYWLAPASTPSANAATAYLLPAWDEYTVAYRDRSAVLDPAHASRVNAGGGVLKPVIVVRAQVVGSWQRRLGRRAAIVTPAPFARLGRDDLRAVTVAAQRYGAFLGTSAELAP